MIIQRRETYANSVFDSVVTAVVARSGDENLSTITFSLTFRDESTVPRYIVVALGAHETKIGER